MKSSKIPGQLNSKPEQTIRRPGMSRRNALLLGSALLPAASVLSACATTPAAQASPNGVRLLGPVTGGKGWIYRSPAVNLAQKGYTMEEYFVAGRAHAYELTDDGELRFDGKW